ncbi:NUDIX domain-containing protein [Saccharopolyspora sp. TS4A08]|uniref:NUDIX domain-containing protein n=1 Tax=Saccharopolyspora ipomoeae TaxID=3042027 RepID=A0ABT6PMT2_9PSEU|nr:NUDIX domain-containing protein [Saccharopolyspora sp. TS4A08]MDI2029322.1 NUDIX domain-containing protein [Saccharopolyspora sp. TS4A08]
MVHRTIVDAHVILVRDGSVLLSRRRGSCGDGMWHLPSGKLDAGESLVEAAIREAWEEVGVRIDVAGLRHVHTLHATAPGVEPRLGVFFEVLAWQGEPENREPDKCYELAWFRVDDLPTDIIAYPAAGLHAYREARPFGIIGWPQAGNG